MDTSKATTTVISAADLEADRVWKNEFDRVTTILDEIAAAHNIELAEWSIHEVVTDRETFETAVIHPNGVQIIYKPYGFSEAALKLEGPVTLLDMWKAGEKLMKLTDDLHHIFIEGFTDCGNGVIEMETGS